MHLDAGTVQTVTQLISNVGYPIVCSGALAYIVIKQNKDHKEEMNGLKDVIQQNTIVLTELKQMIEDIRKEQK